MKLNRIFSGFPLMLFVMLIINSLYTFAWINDGSTFVGNTSPSVIPCVGGPVITIRNSIVNKSIIECANVTNVSMYDSRILSPSREISDAILEFAVISGNVLQSGMFIYGPWTYFGPFNIDNIYAGIPPAESGVAGTSVEVIRQGSEFYVTYSSGRVGYSVSVDASSVGAGSSIPLLDNGMGNDLNPNDGIYTSSNIEVTDSGTGLRTLTINIDDNLGNQWQVTTTIFVDNILPTGDIQIDPEDESDTRIVTLILNSNDNYGVFGCRFGNSVEQLNNNAFEACPSSIPWILTPMNAEKTVFYEIKDLAGNIRRYNASVTLNIPTLSDPPLIDDFVDFWAFDDRVHFRIYYDIPIDLSGMSYGYRIYDSSGCISSEDYELDVCNVTPWFFSEIRNVWHYNLSLVQGVNYVIGAQTYSGSISGQGLSNGFVLDLEPPQIEYVAGSVGQGDWTSSSIIVFNLAASDNVSGVSGFSYRVSQSNLEPNNVLDVFGENATVYLTGLSSGVYNFSVRARNGAHGFSDIYSYSFNVDTQRPEIPYAERPTLSGTGTLLFNWTSSSAFSGIDGYEVVIATDPFFENVVATNFTSNTYFEFLSAVPRTYHFKVRALSNAGLYSLFSNQHGIFFDTMPPEFINTKPRGLIARERPVLHAETNERAECFFGTNLDNMKKFEFTGGYFHEQLVSLSSGTYTYIFTCYDVVGNNQSTTVNFQIDPTKTPTSITPEKTSIRSFTSEFYDVNLTIRSSSEGIGELDLNRFTFSLNGRPYEEFSINDFGNGNYILSFQSPSNEGSYEIEACYGSLCTGNLNLIVSNLNLEIMISLGGGSVINQLSRTSYSSQGNYSIGVATDSRSLSFNNSGSENVMRLKSVIDSGNNFIFVVPGSVGHSTIESKNRRIQNALFLSDNNPSFSLPSTDVIGLKIALSYGNMVFDGFARSARGDQNILIMNRGLAANRKINITLEMS